jgi:hypothetical protein
MGEQTKLSKLETTLSIGAGLVGVGLIGLCKYEPSLTPHITGAGTGALIVAGFNIHDNIFNRPKNDNTVYLFESTLIMSTWASRFIMSISSGESIDNMAFAFSNLGGVCAGVAYSALLHYFKSKNQKEALFGSITTTLLGSSILYSLF